MCSAGCGAHSFLSVGPVSHENQCKLRGFSTSSFIIIRSGIVTVVIVFGCVKKRIEKQ